MKKKVRVTAFLLCVILVLSMYACEPGGNGKYRVADRLAEQSFCVAFRLGDKAGDAVIAALKVLQASGRVSALSRAWFDEDVSLLAGDETALDGLEASLEKRTFIVGYDAGRLPFSGESSGGTATGFDVELAKEVCGILGWKARFLAIDVSRATVELNSGNVDCVWGGFAYDGSNTGVSQSPVYMKNTIVLASLAGSPVRNIGALKGKTLTLSENGYFAAVLEGSKTLGEKPDYIVRLPGGTEACFKALNDGSCAAIITDLAALDYYG
ncbi:MAG: transporter substrate-binding domain-containing protein [Oscillospiraceae bacterium]|jgi:polar amino acid transport system substrate-binding protein|nr:transporter substrate-binding domain-containing protein [Oscillospiraceae bacterium]